MLIDNFTSGADNVTLFASHPVDPPGWKKSDHTSYTQITSNPKFPNRYLYFQVNSILSHQPGILDVGRGERLTVGTGPRGTHFLGLHYGTDSHGHQTGQVNDLSMFTGFLINFDFSNLGLNVNIIFYTDQGTIYFQAGQNINTVLGIPSSVKFPFSSFGKGGTGTPPTLVELKQVGLFRLQIQTEGIYMGSDYIIKSFELY